MWLSAPADCYSSVVQPKKTIPCHHANPIICPPVVESCGNNQGVDMHSHANDNTNAL